MWMMGYKDGREFNTINQESFASHKLIYHHLAMVEQNKLQRELSGTQQVVVSSRWNPTAGQLQSLEELYRRGTRTPSAEQIQHITAELRRYGKIEGKNVFYWFQNHKARERQKRRRQLQSNSSDEQTHNSSNHVVANGEQKESSPGANRTGFEVEETKNWAFPTKSSTLAEKTVSPKGAAAADAERNTADHGWLQFDDQLQRQQQMIRRNATWQTMHLSCSSSSSPTNLTILNSFSNSSAPTSTVNGTMGLPAKLIKTQDFVGMNIFVGPTYYNVDENLNCSGAVEGGETGCGGGAQTLQLFPLRRQLNGDDDDDDEKEEEETGAAMDSTSTNVVTPYQFFEFLPLKN